jgi:hypothetical protein
VLNELGCGTRASEKRLPREVMDSPRAVVLAYLQGLALDAYTNVNGTGLKWAICVDSPGLLDDLQILLRGLGIMSGRISKYNKVYEKSYDDVYVSGAEAQRFCKMVPFLEPTKAERARGLALIDVDLRRNGADVVPLVHGSVLHAELASSLSGRTGSGTGRSGQWRSLCDPRTVWPSRGIVERLAGAGVRLPDQVQRVLVRVFGSPKLSA